MPVITVPNPSVTPAIRSDNSTVAIFNSPGPGVEVVWNSAPGTYKFAMTYEVHYGETALGPILSQANFIDSVATPFGFLWVIGDNDLPIPPPLYPTDVRKAHLYMNNTPGGSTFYRVMTYDLASETSGPFGYRSSPPPGNGALNTIVGEITVVPAGTEPQPPATNQTGFTIAQALVAVPYLQQRLNDLMLSRNTVATQLADASAQLVALQNTIAELEYSYTQLPGYPTGSMSTEAFNLSVLTLVSAFGGVVVSDVQVNAIENYIRAILQIAAGAGSDVTSLPGLTSDQLTAAGQLLTNAFESLDPTRQFTVSGTPAFFEAADTTTKILLLIAFYLNTAQTQVGKLFDQQRKYTFQLAQIQEQSNTLRQMITDLGG